MTLDELRKEKTAEYLGDGCYATFEDHWQIWLHTSDGIRVTNSIALDPQTFGALLSYARRIAGLK